MTGTFFTVSHSITFFSGDRDSIFPLKANTGQWSSKLPESQHQMELRHEFYFGVKAPGPFIKRLEDPK
jgi:hypothetical protein